MSFDGKLKAQSADELAFPQGGRPQHNFKVYIQFPRSDVALKEILLSANATEYIGNLGIQSDEEKNLQYVINFSKILFEECGDYDSIN